MVPEGVTLPILPTLLNCVVNQRLPSGPVVMIFGLPNASPPLLANSVMVPEGVTLPTCSVPLSVNQRLPSGPVMMKNGTLLLVGVANSVMVPEGVFTVSIACPDVRPVALAVIVGLAIAAPEYDSVTAAVGGAVSAVVESLVALEASESASCTVSGAPFAST